MQQYQMKFFNGPARWIPPFQSISQDIPSQVRPYRLDEHWISQTCGIRDGSIILRIFLYFIEVLRARSLPCFGTYQMFKTCFLLDHLYEISTYNTVLYLLKTTPKRLYKLAHSQKQKQILLANLYHSCSLVLNLMFPYQKFRFPNVS